MLRIASRATTVPLLRMAGARSLTVPPKHLLVDTLKKAAGSLPIKVEEVFKDGKADITDALERLKASIKTTPVGTGPALGTKKRVAVIGGGVAGVICANQLFSDPGKRYDVSLFEADSRIGGNVRTVVANDPQGNPVPIDTGVVFTEENFYPNLYKFLLSDELNIKTEMVKLGMTGAFADGKGGEEIWSNTIYGTNLRSKFYSESDRLMLGLATIKNISNPLVMFGTTAQKWLDDNKFSNEFVQKSVIPMLLTFAITRNGLLSVPLAILHMYFGGGALNFNQGSYGRRAVGGMQTYMDKFAVKLGSVIRTSTPVTAIRRLPDGKVSVTSTTNGQSRTETFDDVVITVLKDTAVQLLGPSAGFIEKEIFSKIAYEEMAVTVHNDPNVISPSLKNADGTWNYQFFNYRYLGNDFGDYVRGATTYVPRWTVDAKHTEVLLPLLTYSNVQDYEGVINPRPEYVVDRKVFRHVRQSIPQSLAGLALHVVQGKGGVWYAGNDIVINFHEGALCSGLVIAKALGVDYPFKDDLKQAWVYNLFENYMLHGKPPMELLYLNPH